MWARTFVRVDRGVAQFRVMGFGLSLFDRVERLPPFSVRSGKRWEFRLGRYGIQVHTPWGPWR